MNFGREEVVDLARSNINRFPIISYSILNVCMFGCAAQQ